MSDRRKGSSRLLIGALVVNAALSLSALYSAWNFNHTMSMMRRAVIQRMLGPQ